MEAKAFCASECPTPAEHLKAAGKVDGPADASHCARNADESVKQPFINCEEKIERIVGRRTAPPDGLSLATSTKSHAVAWQKALGGLRVPRGVFRFKTHEEANEWLWRMITRPTS